MEDSHQPQHGCSLGLDKPASQGAESAAALTDDGRVLGSVEGADDDEAEAFVLLAVNDHVAGLQGRCVRVGGDDGDHRGSRGRRPVAARGAVLRGHGARTAAVDGTRLTWRSRTSWSESLIHLLLAVTATHSSSSGCKAGVLGRLHCKLNRSQLQVTLLKWQ